MWVGIRISRKVFENCGDFIVLISINASSSKVYYLCEITETAAIKKLFVIISADFYNRRKIHIKTKFLHSGGLFCINLIGSTNIIILCNFFI